MDIDITGRNVDITDRFRAYATEKSEKIAHLADRALALEIKASRHSENKGASGDRVELTLIGKGPVVRAEASGADKYAAFDIAIGRLLERVRRAKDRKKIHRGHHRPTSLRDAAAEDFSVVAVTPADVEVLERLNADTVPVQEEHQPTDDGEQQYCPVVIRKKVFASVSMTVDDAVDYMELVGHDFYLFIDSETQQPSVVYRRKGWDYGVICLADEAMKQAAG
ncbi:ribosome hibernation-promoting factor, HPF/YfiA family [Rathayibacter toxicus]|uniref:ribosome hibernation-promoting factor, HPF/YfiA family n=1 Tax=Rathayibacter toxicus TaxID=145458 RepID=UPI001C05D2CE|nr:ribosome-associated translation inhibitor RaiA [Rathayibacter toxicus]QWL31874.1 ribosome-associated translation inhibitor RaiA [Rathayibacter toxicus]QWL33967.1 ribosome-associated translation inhibitor RaiA [Rathayibacter toxicus]QWL36099.1 ribosome-associated translation inhibitor RaiA [Rathayibacter toxicus]QWL38190.1 ribosome-associated translation inhibitor RaiA [Rathayibacter toxicus]QWL40279.1 ribosome-associated translation inhibitor RaiA [Rathayibacter toxicus]